MDYNAEAIRVHTAHKGKLAVRSLTPIQNKDDLATIYTPGVAEVSRQIGADKTLARTMTMKGRTIAVVSDGSAILGLGNLGPEAALPVMEGKAVLFKEMADVDAMPLCLDTQDTEEIIRTVKLLAPNFGGINLEDIAAPRCFEIEKRLRDELDIVVFHDDQHGTATVVLAALYNALRVVGKELGSIRAVINGAGAAGIAIAKLLQFAGIGDLIICDSKGIIHTGRTDITGEKQELAHTTNTSGRVGSLQDALRESDVFIGVSAGNVLQTEDIRTMAPDAIVFAMANPTPEIMPADARAGGARIVGTGRSDFANQVNNALVFPGIFRGALDHGVTRIEKEHLVKAARALAACVENPQEERILPDVLDKSVAAHVAEAFM